MNIASDGRFTKLFSPSLTIRTSKLECLHHPIDFEIFARKTGAYLSQVSMGRLQARAVDIRLDVKGL